MASLRLGDLRVVEVLGFYPHAIVGGELGNKEASVLKVKLEDGSEKLVPFPPPENR